MSEDRKTIGLTKNAREILDRIVERDRFKLGSDVAKFALAVAVNAGIKPGNVDGAETVWSTTIIESELRETVQVLFPEADMPYRAIESLINAGLEIIGKHMEDRGDLVLTDLMPPRPAPRE
ncbi:MAG TPA: hypothetical protein VE222_09550 [Nitrospiraceae bacterium]|nr:hypothetical protein [Nitrospiraceae bacterium]